MDIEISIGTDNSELIKQATTEAIVRALEAIGMQAESYAKLELETPKAHKDGTTRPNVDTGRLVNSITHTTEGDNTAVIGSNVEYAAYVELGTQKSNPYPYLRPAIENHVQEYSDILKEMLQNT